jgi:hypothetical protein
MTDDWRAVIDKELMARACEELGHRRDTPCQASVENLLEQALEQLATARADLAKAAS